MATDGHASWIDSTDEYSGDDLRRLDSVLMTPGGPTSAPFAVKSGHRVNGAGLQVSVGGSPESWTCTPGPAVVSTPAYATQGGWRVEIPNAKSGTIGARPGAGTSRIDLIVVRIYDTQAIGSGPADVVVERVVGQAGQTPSAPTPPAGSITYEVARLTVPASGAIVVTQSTERTVAAGGVLPVATTASRDRLETDGIAYPGLTVFNSQTGRNETFVSAGVWDYPGRWQAYTPIPAGVYSSATGRYSRVGKTVHGEARIAVSNIAIATIEITTPTVMKTPSGPKGVATAYRDGALATATASANAANRLIFITPAGTLFGPNVPGAWANGHFIELSFTYEEA